MRAEITSLCVLVGRAELAPNIDRCTADWRCTTDGKNAPGAAQSEGREIDSDSDSANEAVAAPAEPCPAHGVMHPVHATAARVAAAAGAAGACGGPTTAGRLQGT